MLVLVGCWKNCERCVGSNKENVIMKAKDLLISPSLYTLFLYTLINDDWLGGDFVLSERIPKTIHEKLSVMGADVFSIPKRNRLGNFLSNWDYLRFLMFSTGRQYRAVYGNDEFMPSCKYRHLGMKLIEDGSFNKESKAFFIERRWRINRFWVNYWFRRRVRTYVPYGYDPRAKEIFHTENVTLPEEISKKGILIDLFSLWNGKNKQKKSKILELFGIDETFVQNLTRYSTVLVTQELPLPDADKIRYYRHLLEGNDESAVLIKTHYAEKTDYQSEFPKAYIISQPVPFQLFKLLGYAPKKVLTICSSAITSFLGENTEIVFMGSEVDQRIVEQYGVIRLNDFTNSSSS